MASADRQEAFDELLLEEGRTITFRDVDLLVVLNVGYPAAIRQVPEQRFDERTQSKIEFRKTDIDYPPKVGEDFKDENDYHHAIKIVTSTEFSWQCECDMTEPD